MANLRVLPFLALAALLIAPGAAAQAAPAKATITTYTVTPESATIPLGGEAAFNVTVAVTFENIICPNATTAALSIVQSGQGPAGVEGTIGGTITLTVPANIPTPPATTPTPGTTTIGTGTGQFIVKVSPAAAPNHDHVFRLNATYAGPVPQGCQASALPGDALQPSMMQSKQVSIKTGPGAGNVTTTGPTNGSGTTGPKPTETSPLADVPFVALLVLGVALVASRRRLA